ncbi:hypothetical protein LUZ63_012238 [Rhynchospora breviuscula]|uniref:KIB1-4 beta-propeller domain-containing protein n=1 Tax=Rhynchospora breviuscula TaxID=2022672 RepID=A0A9Q0CKP8_9POAL|nr:hypothetical protein LUZ63_012238 [Rhynchospora breviuscula]
MCEERDWSGLLIELLYLVSQKLPTLSDYVRFRAVCKTWFFSAPLSDHPPQLPWLVKHELGYCPDNVVDDELQFYSIFSGEKGIMCRILSRTHKYRGKELKGPSHGCLLLIQSISSYESPTNLQKKISSNEQSCVLFNPLYNKDISLPSLCFRSSTVSPYPVWTGTNPISDRDIIFVDRDMSPGNITGGSWFFYDRDNNKWIVSEKEFFCSCSYLRGKLYSLKEDYFTEVFDVSSGNKLYKIQPPRDEQPPFRPPDRSYLIESAGEIFRVSLNWNLENFLWPEKTVFSIYKLANRFEGRNGDSHVWSWVKVSSIGDQMLFLDRVNGFSMSCIPFAGQRGNCIYFIHSNIGPYRYNIEDGTVEQLLQNSPFKQFTWFVPDLR